MEPELRTVLVVEDEKLLLEMNALILKRNGFSVLSARCAREAVHLAESYGGNIDLLLTDLNMPEIDGERLASLVGKLREGIKVVFLTGSCCGETIDRLSRRHQVVCKPFGMEEMLTVVRRALAYT